MFSAPFLPGDLERNYPWNVYEIWTSQAKYPEKKSSRDFLEPQTMDLTDGISRKRVRERWERRI